MKRVQKAPVEVGKVKTRFDNVDISPRLQVDGNSIAELESALLIDQHDLDEMWVRQPEAFYRVSKQLPLLISQRDAAKQDLAECEAKADADIRAETIRHKEKVTEAEVKALTKLDTRVIARMNELNDLVRQVGSLQALKEAFEQRGKALDGLTRLYLANYYGANTDGSNAARASLRDTSASRVRDTLKDRRRDYGNRD